MNNGTIPIQIALKILGRGGEIITTPFSYVATSASIVWEGCTPVFVDIHPEYLTIDESKIEALITNKTTCILATHVFGNPCNVEIIENIAKKNNLKVIYDAAHSFGVKYKGKSLFEYGDVSTCSFHATKLFHTGEGEPCFVKMRILDIRCFIVIILDIMDHLILWFRNKWENIRITGSDGLVSFPYMEEIIKSVEKLWIYISQL